MFTRYIPSVKETIVYKKGRDAQDNFDLIDASKDNDIWFHIHGDSSAHVVASINDLDISLDKKQLRDIIKQGAVICKEQSSYKSDKNVPIVYTRIKDVEKSTPVGTVSIYNGKIVTI
jgi:predicted ribosome quality control (RQC) complex YloA/Tae2 family protein